MFIFDDKKSTNGRGAEGAGPRGLGFSWARRAEGGRFLRALGRRPQLDAQGVVRGGRIGTTSVASLPELGRELDRSRRFGHGFVLFRFPSLGRGTEGGLETADALRAAVRRVDSVWTDGDSVYMLAPEADRATGAGVLARLRRQLTELFGAGELDQAAFVVFPDEGQTSGALLETLLERARAAGDSRSGRMPAERGTTVEGGPAPESGV